MRSLKGQASTVAGALAAIASLILACGQGSQAPSDAPKVGDSKRLDDARPPASVLLTGKPLYSQGKEELIIRDFFRDRREGFFLDVGCATPIMDSNTYYLEKHLGWSGIAVDALPEYEASWRQRRARSKFFCYLVTDHSDTVEPFYRSELRGISSYRRPMKGPAGKDITSEEIQVPTITLTRLLEQNGVSRIDFLSMDIEGAEPLALAGFDIARFKPELACVEAKPANRESILRYFTERGYHRIKSYREHDQVNYYFTSKAIDH